MNKNIFIITLFFLFLAHNARGEDDLLQLKAAIHLSSTISEGGYTLEQIARAAKDSGISVVVFTDRDLMRWEYGLWPLRNLFKKTVEQGSVFRYGIKRYLKEIEVLGNKFPEIILIPGVESAPFYYWQGSVLKSAYILKRPPIDKDRELADTKSELLDKLRMRRTRQPGQLESGRLVMNNWHIHLLAIGLDKYADYKNLPVIGNPSGLRGKFNVLMLWPIIALILGIWLCRNDIYSFVGTRGRRLSGYSKKKFIFGVMIILAGFLFILNNWPFFSLKFDQYHGDQKILPYQNYIDYVKERKGLAFWAHPEAEYTAEVGDVGFLTRKHP